MPVVGFLGGMIGPWELGIILVIVLILFGAGRLPQVFETFGKGIKSFRDAQKPDEEGPIDVSRGELPAGDDLADAQEVREKEKSKAG